MHIPWWMILLAVLAAFSLVTLAICYFDEQYRKKHPYQPPDDQSR